MEETKWGFNPWALLFGPFWFYANGMWTRGSTLLIVLLGLIFFSIQLNIELLYPVLLVNLFCAATADPFRKQYEEKKNFK